MVSQHRRAERAEQQRSNVSRYAKIGTYRRDHRNMRVAFRKCI
jgi:hypothetical protein